MRNKKVVASLLFNLKIHMQIYQSKYINEPINLSYIVSKYATILNVLEKYFLVGDKKNKL